MNIPVGPLEVFALSGHMVRIKLCWDANNVVGPSKKKESWAGLVRVLCFESPTALFTVADKNKTETQFLQHKGNIYNSKFRS